jgi:hypothetical protein
MLKELAHTRYKVRALLFVALLVTLFLSMFVEAEVINNNMAMDLYKTDEDFDMVRIPLMFGGMVQLLAVIFFTISQCTPRTKYWGLLSLLSAFIALYLILGTVAYWSKPNYFSIAMGYVPSAIVVALWMLNVWHVRKQKSQSHHVEHEIKD